MTKAHVGTNLGEFPPAPATLQASQRQLWNGIVHSFPADWFRVSDFPLIEAMIRAWAMTDDLSARIEVNSDLAELKTLLQLRDIETRRAAALATKLRMPPQSRSDRHLAGRLARDAAGTRPWERAATVKFFRGRQ